MQPLKVAICEDINEDLQKLLSVLRQSSINTDCTVFTSGEELLKVYSKNKFDLLLIDIYMNGITGIETVSKIREIDKYIPVAFITTSTEHTLESYRLSAFKYIEKPVKQKDIDEILQLADIKKENIPSLIIHKNGKTEKIPFKDILYIEQQARKVFIYLNDKSIIEVYEKLSAFKSQLEGQPFFCSHKSFYVNLNFVRYIDSDLKCFVMENYKNVPILRQLMNKAKHVYEDFLFAKTRGEN